MISTAKGEGSEGETTKVSSESETATPTPKTPKSGRMDDRRFFGDNFPLDLMNTNLAASKVYGECLIWVVQQNLALIFSFSLT